MIYQCSSCPAEVKMVYGPTFCMKCTASRRYQAWWAQYEGYCRAGMDSHAAQETTTAIFRAMEAR